MSSHHSVAKEKRKVSTSAEKGKHSTCAMALICLSWQIFMGTFRSQASLSLCPKWKTRYIDGGAVLSRQPHLSLTDSGCGL